MASSWFTVSRTVIRFSFVISSETGWSGSVAKRTSRFVRMPTRRFCWPPASRSTTGMPEMPLVRITACASARVASGVIVTGLTTMPDSNFLTCRTSSACWSGSRLRWITPRPPACAMAIARRASVTVSMAAEMIGMPSRIDRVRRVDVSASPGRTLDAAGRSSTSSKVSAIGAPISSETKISRWAICQLLRGGLFRRKRHLVRERIPMRCALRVGGGSYHPFMTAQRGPATPFRRVSHAPGRVAIAAAV